ncbi:MAG: YihY/virulence factor BrkB family protein, partial [Rhodospirillales bacterium]|nr:YihY/virulence factor BrkB family protein [Rhodospirillales bacterium]
GGVRFVLRVGAALATDRASMAAAGAAYYATLALFPAISTLITLYGLVFDRESVAGQMQALRAVAPAPVYALIAQRVAALLAQPAGRLGAGLALGLGLTLWSASAGTRSVLTALNVAYGMTERRGVVRFYALSLVLTLLAMVVAALAIAVLVALPLAAGLVGLGRAAERGAHLAGFAALLGFVAASLAVMYRVGTVPGEGRRAVWPGVVAATLLWLGASAALGVYMGRLANLGATYGPLAAVVGVMLWFYVSAYAVLVGAEVNAEWGA